MNTSGEYLFKVRSYECGRDGLATLASICNYLQEAAGLHAGELGFSRSDFDAAGSGLAWILTKMRVKMDRYPGVGEDVKIMTFPRGGHKIVAWRDFIVKGGDGAAIGVASTEWIVINLATRKISQMPQSVFDAANTEFEPVLGTDPFTRLKFPDAADDGEPLRLFARNSDIDVNRHVNNVHYIEWMLEPFAGVQPVEMEIVFKSETFAGDEVVVTLAHSEDGFVFHRVASAEGKDHIVARTKSTC